MQLHKLIMLPLTCAVSYHVSDIGNLITVNFLFQYSVHMLVSDVLYNICCTAYMSSLFSSSSLSWLRTSLITMVWKGHVEFSEREKKMQIFTKKC